jgi:putative ABC transport system permease protein
VQLIRLTIKNIKGNSFKSLAIFLAVMGVAAFLLATTIIITGAQYSLDSGLKRMGADLLVVPSGAETKIETALLMGKPTNIWMPRNKIQKIADIPGVEAVSPQIYLNSVYGSPYCSLSEMFMVVYDPASDFTISPWMANNLSRGLAKGEVLGGAYISLPKGEKNIKLYNSSLTLLGNLDPTGTGIDQTIFMTSETAQEMAKSSPAGMKDPFNFNPDNISTILVRVAPGIDIHRVAIQILKSTLDMVPIESPSLFGTFRNQMNGLLWGFFVITLIVWALAVILIGVIFSMAANGRKREMAVLRAVGATRSFIFRSVITEAALLAISGSFLGLGVAGFGIYLSRDVIAESLKMPFLFPSVSSFIGLFSAGVGLAFASVILAALIPAIRISRQELAMAMRE